MALQVKNRHEQHCPVCEQPMAEGDRVATAQEVMLGGAAAYSWCPQCGREVGRPWSAQYMARWTEAFKRVCRDLEERHAGSGLLWRVVKADAVVELLLDVSDSIYVLHYRQNRLEQSVERFASRESAHLRGEELLRSLLAQGFTQLKLPSVARAVV